MGVATYLYRIDKNGKLESKVFDSNALPGEPWVDSPAKCIAKPAEEAAPEISQEFTREELIAEAQRQGVFIDGRWGIGRIKEALGLGD